MHGLLANEPPDAGVPMADADEHLMGRLTTIM